MERKVTIVARIVLKHDRHNDSKRNREKREFQRHYYADDNVRSGFQTRTGAQLNVALMTARTDPKIAPANIHAVTATAILTAARVTVP